MNELVTNLYVATKHEVPDILWTSIQLRLRVYRSADISAQGGLSLRWVHRAREEKGETSESRHSPGEARVEPHRRLFEPRRIVINADILKHTRLKNRFAS